MRAALSLGLMLVAVGCGPKADAPAPPSTAKTPVVEAKPDAAKAPVVAAKPAPAPKAKRLPASDRVFAVSLDGGPDVVPLGAKGDALWAWDVEAGRELWRVQGPAVAQAVAAGDIGNGHQLFVAWGVGRNFLRVPLVLQALDPKTGAPTELWRFAGERADCAHLSVADVDRDGKLDLAFAHYESKYFVRPRHLKADGSVIEGPLMRMASSRAFGDVDGDGLADEVIGRVYGDDKGLVGDLHIDRGGGRDYVQGIDRGVKAVAVADLDGKGGRAFVADGWVANYGKEAKAQLVRVGFTDGKPVIDRIGTSYDEFTFFGIHPVDVDGDGLLELVVRGNKRVSVFKPTASGPWSRRTLAEVGPVLNVAVGRTSKGAFVWVPGKRETRAVAIR